MPRRSARPEGYGPEGVPLYLIEILDRLRESLQRLPERLAAALRRSPGAGGGAGDDVPGGAASRHGTARPAAGTPGDAGYSAAIKPVVVRLARDFSARMGAGIADVEAALKKAAARAAVAYARGVLGAGVGPGGAGPGAPGLASPLGSAGNPIQLRRNPMGSWSAATPPPIYARVRMPSGFGPGGTSGRRRGRSGWSGWRGKGRAWAGAAGTAWRSAAANARRSYRAGRRAYNAGRGAGGAGKAASAALLGRGAALDLSQLGGAVMTLAKAADSMRAFAERSNDGNRYLAPYSGKISGALGRLELGDERRNLGMARATEGTASRLAERVNEMRDSTQGMQRLWKVATNQAGAVASAIITPTFKEFSSYANQAADWLEKSNPASKVDAAHSYAAWSAAWVMGLATSGGSVAGATKAADEAWRQTEIERKAGRALPEQGWTEFMRDAMSLPALNPPRKFVP